ncbi:MAG: NUDIX hydrolase [Firmicutes bacterium]|nr:NUDIX hydrolase [Bacillota bacterium]
MEDQLYRFCPVCGHALAWKTVKLTEPKRLVCTACGFIFYLDPKVAVGVICTIDGKIVLLQRGIEPALGKWVFPGGFVDIGDYL